MADQRPILPLTAGIGAVNPMGIDSGEQSFRTRTGMLQDLLSQGDVDFTGSLPVSGIDLGFGGDRQITAQDAAMLDAMIRKSGSRPVGDAGIMSAITDLLSGEGTPRLKRGAISADLLQLLGPRGREVLAGGPATPSGPQSKAPSGSSIPISMSTPGGEMSTIPGLGGSDVIDDIFGATPSPQTAREFAIMLGSQFPTRTGEVITDDTAVTTDDTTVTTDEGGGARVSPEAEAVRAAEVSGIGAQPDITTDVEVSGAEAPEAPDDAGMGMYGKLLQTSLDSYNEAMGNAPSGAKTIEQYKQEFSEATGIDISGDPDNKAALMAFGFALMQNKAGRGFNVGEMLKATGEAGEKALPLIEKARQEARAGKLAAGKYAMDSARLDDSTRQQYIVGLDKYMRERKDKIMDSMTAYIQSLEAGKAKTAAEREKARMKFYYDTQLELLKADAEGAQKVREGQFDFKNKQTVEDPNLPGLKITLATRASDGRTIYPFAVQESVAFGTALADVNEGLAAADTMIATLTKIQGQEGGVTVQRAKELFQGIGGALGIDLNKEPIFEKVKRADGTTVEQFVGYSSKPKALRTNEAVRDRIIAQFKRFLTQETGNGISNVDIQNIEKLLGEVNWFTDPADAIKRLEEAKKIFQGKKDKLMVHLENLDDKSRYPDEKEYLDTRRNIAKAIKNAYKLDMAQPGIDKDTGLPVYKVY